MKAPTYVETDTGVSDFRKKCMDAHYRRVHAINHSVEGRKKIKVSIKKVDQLTTLSNHNKQKMSETIALKRNSDIGKQNQKLLLKLLAINN